MPTVKATPKPSQSLARPIDPNSVFSIPTVVGQLDNNKPCFLLTAPTLENYFLVATLLDGWYGELIFQTFENDTSALLHEIEYVGHGSLSAMGKVLVNHGVVYLGGTIYVNGQPIAQHLVTDFMRGMGDVYTISRKAGLLDNLYCNIKRYGGAVVRDYLNGTTTALGDDASLKELVAFEALRGSLKDTTISGVGLSFFMEAEPGRQWGRDTVERASVALPIAGDAPFMPLLDKEVREFLKPSKPTNESNESS